jgi:hypothetical protein
MTLDETFNQFLDAQFVEVFGQNYRKIRDTLNDLNRTKGQHLQRIDKLEKTAAILFGNIDAINKNNEKNSQEILDLQLQLKKYGGLILKVDKRNNELSQKIIDLERTAGLHSGSIESVTQNNKILSQEITDLRSQLEKCGDSIANTDTKNNELEQTTEELGIKLRRLTEDIRIVNDRNKELEKKIVDLELKNKSLLSRSDEYELKRTHGKPERLNGETGNSSYGLYSGQSEKAPHNVRDSIITKFNNWAANPRGYIPSGFTFLAGDLRIRTQQQIVETAEETKWITNCTGGRKYLFPNPNSFNQMTDIRELYDMDQNMLREKGRNKIEITAACEISASGWIEFAGELKILP